MASQLRSSQLSTLTVTLPASWQVLRALPPLASLKAWVAGATSLRTATVNLFARSGGMDASCALTGAVMDGLAQAVRHQAQQLRSTPGTAAASARGGLQQLSVALHVEHSHSVRESGAGDHGRPGAELCRALGAVVAAASRPCSRGSGALPSDGDGGDPSSSATEGEGGLRVSLTLSPSGLAPPQLQLLPDLTCLTRLCGTYAR